MPKHYLSITYPPKIKPVNDGWCTQTIRKGRKIKVGDVIEFHNWADKAYWSPWVNRFDVIVTEAVPILIDDVFGIGSLYQPESNLIEWHSWDGIYADILAERDYIDPPVGGALKAVLFKLNEPPKEPEPYQIIRWVKADE